MHSFLASRAAAAWLAGALELPLLALGEPSCDGKGYNWRGGARCSAHANEGVDATLGHADREEHGDDVEGAVTKMTVSLLQSRHDHPKFSARRPGRTASTLDDLDHARAGLLAELHAVEQGLSETSPQADTGVASHGSVEPVTISTSSGKAKVLLAGRPIGPNDGHVNGAAGSGYPHVAKAVGVNALRTWAYSQWYWAFKGAKEHGLTVSAGIGLTRDASKYADEYCDVDHPYWTDILAKTLQQVSEYKSHPSLLWWTVGNELEEQVDWANGNDCLWKRVEQFASEIKKIDPNHPVSTVLANAANGKVGKIRDLCPSLDFLGINVYGNDAHGMGSRLRGMGWRKPFAITEYGVPGWWSVPRTSWGARLETITSARKAPFFVSTYKDCHRDQQCIGSFAFLWGWKWEKTGTWFGLFDEWKDAGGRNYALDTLFTLEKEWTPNSHFEAPVTITSVSVLGQDPSIGFSAEHGAVVQIDVQAAGNVREVNEVAWVVTAESDSTASGNDHEDAFAPIRGIVRVCGRPGLRGLLDTSKLDIKRGTSYRVYIFVRGGGITGTVESSASIPFLVGKQSKCHNARRGDRCYNEVQKVKANAERQGVSLWPASSLLPSSSFAEFQASLHKEKRADCPAPCSIEVPAHMRGSCSGGPAPQPEPHPPGPSPGPACEDAVAGSTCYSSVQWAMKTGIHQHPSWYPGLSASSPFEDFQQQLHDKGEGHCSFPCKLTTTTTTTTLSLVCHDAEPGSSCYDAVKWAMRTGIRQHPDWYPGLTPQSDFEDFQLQLHNQKKGHCDLPCARSPPPTPRPPPHFDSGSEGTDSCHDATPGSACYTSVVWAMQTGIPQHPTWYPGVTASSRFEDVQLHLYENKEGGCGYPCKLITTTSTTTTFCKDAKPGSTCYDAVMWAMNTGIRQHPDWYPGLKPSSSFGEFQLQLHNKQKGHCDLPCV